MEIQHALTTRRSIRKYTQEKVPDIQINNMLEAAMYAPSANNKQPWHFVIIRNKETLEQIPIFHPNAKMIKDASLGILVCTDDDIENSVGYWIQDCAAATQNILLSAHGMGLGAVWCGIFPREERIVGIKKLFSLPQNITPFSLISIGHPDEQKEQPQRFSKERIHIEKW